MKPKSGTQSKAAIYEKLEMGEVERGGGTQPQLRVYPMYLAKTDLSCYGGLHRGS